MIKRSNLRSELVRYTVVLMSGTLVAQALGYLFLPLITQLFTPDEYAEQGVFLRIVALGSALATARYELSLPLPKADVHAFRLFRFGLRIAFFTALLATGISFGYFAFKTDQSYNLFFWALIPFMIFFLAFFNLGTNWAIREKAFKVISYARMTNSVVGNGLRVGFGYLGLGSSGLILATVIGQMVGNSWFMQQYRRATSKFKVKARSKRTLVLAHEHRDFPIVNLPQVLMELGRDLLVAIIILDAYGDDPFGLYDFSYRILKLPFMLAGLAIGQVFFQRCAEMVNNGRNIVPILSKAVFGLVLISIVPFGLLFFYGEELFGLVFAEKWQTAGTYAQIMAIWLMANFWISPISSIPVILHRQKEFFFMGAFATVLMFAGLCIPAYVYDASIETTLWIVSISQAAYFFVAIGLTFYFAKLGRK